VEIPVKEFERVDVFQETTKDGESYDRLIHVLRYTPRTNERKYVETARYKAFKTVLNKFPKFTYLRLTTMDKAPRSENFSRAEVQRYVGELHG